MAVGLFRSWQVQFRHLLKTPTASTTNEYRPITIFSFAYRCWTSMNARHLLDYASTWVDAGAYGNRKGLQAGHLWRTIVQSIETAYATNQPLSGLTADIEKAFKLFTTVASVLCSSFCRNARFNFVCLGRSSSTDVPPLSCP